MSIHQRPITEIQALAVARRMGDERPESIFEVVGRDDLMYVKEVRPMNNYITGHEFDQIFMWGKGPSTAYRRNAA